MDSISLTLMAEVSALRHLMINLHAHRFLEEPSPVAAARLVQASLRQSPTLAPRTGCPVDPAVSDAIAAMTDERMHEFMDRVIERLEILLGLRAATAEVAAGPLWPLDR